MTRLRNVAELASVQQAEATEIEAPFREPWPEPSEEAFHGLAGRYVRKIEPHTEADSMGILVQFLAMFGNLLGRGPHFRVEADEHHLNLFVVLVGESSKGRKGVSAGQAKRLLNTVDSDWCDQRIQHGLSSGEGLIWAVRDPIEKLQPVQGKGRSAGEMETVITDEGVVDKRLFILESEFASTLRVLKRDGNTLSATIRNAWDSGKLSSLTKNSPARATGAHISIVGHITKQELLRYLDSTETANGFGNRFLWSCVRRSKFLPEGGQAHNLDFELEVREMEEVLTFSRQVTVLRRDSTATQIWAKVYPELSGGKPGMLGSMIGRAEAQTMRLACLYALLDRSSIVRSQHLLAALALWQYCEDSARWIFGDALGDPVADQILRWLRTSPQGLTRTEIGNLLGRHCKKGDLSRALALLLDQGLAKGEKQRTGGRPTECWRATSLACEKSGKSE